MHGGTGELVAGFSMDLLAFASCLFYLSELVRQLSPCVILLLLFISGINEEPWTNMREYVGFKVVHSHEIFCRGWIYIKEGYMGYLKTI